VATASVTYPDFVSGTLIQSAQVDTNFADIVSFLNNETIHKDGSVAATAHLSGPATDPSSGAQYTNKTYVDRLGIVAQEALTASTGNFGANADTDMNLANVSVVAGRTYSVHLHTQCQFNNVNPASQWEIFLKINGAEFDRFWHMEPRTTGVVVGTIDSYVYWTPSVTAATDDLLVSVREVVDGATLQFEASAVAKRTLTLTDLGVL